jgi:formylglycine-generating enzyme required for sulfatase activity
MNTENPTKIEKKDLEWYRSTRTSRGGHWYNNPYSLRTNRKKQTPLFRDDNVGFRLVRNK